MATPRNFPDKTALALLTFAALVYLWYRAVDPAKGLNPTIFADSFRIHLRHAPVPVVAVAPPITPTKPAEAGHQTQVAISPYLIDVEGTLDPFFAAMRRLELSQIGPATDTVTILHYGDSPTTADLITGDVRSLLQARFGDAGHGFLLTGKPWAWYQHWGVDLSDHGWQISTAVGKGREETYGIGGASFEGSTGASTHIALKDTNQTSLEIAYLARPNGGAVSVAANGSEVESFSTADETPHPAWHTVALPAGTKTVDIKPVDKAVRLFGESLTTGRRGVLYDSLGLNGASTSVLSNGFNPASWAAELKHDAPRLVIINYGTNESGFGSYVDKQYEPTLRTAIARVRAALPGVPILIMSPMDRGRRTGVDQIETYDTIPRLVAIQRRVAAELHCGFFDTYDAMGGEGTMERWYNGHPRLVAGDLIHPTPQGASIVAQLFVKDLTLGYDSYVRRQAGLPPLPVAQTPKLPTPEPAKIQVKAPAPPAITPPSTDTSPQPADDPAATPRPEPKEEEAAPATSATPPPLA